MALKFRKVLMLAKIESVYGSDPTPTGAANAILTHGLQIRPLEGQTISRDLDRATLGNDVQIHVGSHVMVEFDVEVAGAGAAGDAPAYGPLLRACAMDETINAGTDVQYDPVSASEESVTCYVYFDGQKHILLGARGTWSLRLTALQIPYLHFVLTGLWADPASEADPTPDVSAFVTPIECNNTNTPTVTLHTIDLVMESFNFDQSNETPYRQLVGAELVPVVDRAPSGNVTFEAPTLTTKNWFTTAKANTTGALQIIHGTTGGNIVQFDAPAVQLLNPTYGESQSVRMIQAGLSFVPSSGDDDFKLTVK